MGGVFSSDSEDERKRRSSPPRAIPKKDNREGSSSTPTTIPKKDDREGSSITATGTPISKKDGRDGSSITATGTLISKKDDREGSSITATGTAISEKDDRDGSSITATGTDDREGSSITATEAAISKKDDGEGSSVTATGTDDREGSSITETAISKKDDREESSITATGTPISKEDDRATETAISKKDDLEGSSITAAGTAISKKDGRDGSSITATGTLIPKKDDREGSSITATGTDDLEGSSITATGTKISKEDDREGSSITATETAISKDDDREGSSITTTETTISKEDDHDGSSITATGMAISKEEDREGSSVSKEEEREGSLITSTGTAVSKEEDREGSSITTMAKEEHSEGSSVVCDLINFLNASPTAFHAVDEAKKCLQNAGFEQVSEREDWNLEAGKRYFFTRNHSTIVAFAIGKKYVAGNGFHIVGAHTDSPCLKLKPVSKVAKGGYLEVGVQTYGSGLWHTWFDRDLTVAGRVIIKEEKDGSVTYSHRLVKIDEPIMRIPTLAIHLERDDNGGFKVNTQSHLVPVLATSIKAELNKVIGENGPVESGVQKSNERKNTDNSKHHSLLLQLLATRIGCAPDDICNFELQACDTQPSVVGGAMKEFIFSGRLDNLCMSFCSLKALIDTTSAESSLEDETGARMVALFDHEEVGSNLAQGAGSPAMLDALSRITNSFSTDSKLLLQKAIQRSFLVSADMAHALHPNYMDKHEENHQPKLHGGLVIKHNATTNAVTSFIFREIAVKYNLPTQDFVVRNDKPCGSTIGPIVASGVGIRTVDVGAPQLSMHSIREMCAVDDVKHSYEHFKAYFQESSHFDAKISVDV